MTKTRWELITTALEKGSMLKGLYDIQGCQMKKIFTRTLALFRVEEAFVRICSSK